MTPWQSLRLQNKNQHSGENVPRIKRNAEAVTVAAMTTVAEVAAALRMSAVLAEVARVAVAMMMSAVVAALTAGTTEVARVAAVPRVVTALTAGILAARVVALTAGMIAAVKVVIASTAGMMTALTAVIMAARVVAVVKVVIASTAGMIAVEGMIAKAAVICSASIVTVLGIEPATALNQRRRRVPAREEEGTTVPWCVTTASKRGINHGTVQSPLTRMPLQNGSLPGGRQKEIVIRCSSTSRVYSP